MFLKLNCIAESGVYFIAVLVALSACDSEIRPPPVAKDGIGSAPKRTRTPYSAPSTSDSGLPSPIDAGVNTELPKEAGSEPRVVFAEGGTAPRAVCGDGTWDPTAEACDGQEPARKHCSQLGFDVGQLRCAPDCEWDTAGCSGTESCFDGIDNDGDTLIDCDDAEDCRIHCTDSCLAVISIDDEQLLNGAIWGHKAPLSSACDQEDAQQLVLHYYSRETGKLDFSLASDHNLSLSVFRDCAPDAKEVLCGGRTRLTIDAFEDESYFVTVSGPQGKVPSAFQLGITRRRLACGDGVRDLSERCDDGNSRDGDGCDPDCNVETQESEPVNNAAEGADTLVPHEPIHAELYPETDVDTFAVRLETRGWLRAEVSNLGDGACALGLMNPEVSILSLNNVILASSVSDERHCAPVELGPLEAGTYLVRVAAGAKSARATFPYELRVATGACDEKDVCSGT